MQPSLHLPFYRALLPAPTLLQALLTFHHHSLVLKLAIPVNVLFAILLAIRHLSGIVTRAQLFTTYLPLLHVFPVLPLKLLLLLTILPVAVSIGVLIPLVSILSTTASLLTTLDFPGAMAINILIHLLLSNLQRRPHRPCPKLVPPSPWPERLHIADFMHDDEMDNLRPLNPDWVMVKGLGKKGPQVRVGWENGFYRGLKVTGKRKMPPRVFLGRESSYHSIDRGEKRVEVGEDGCINRVDVVNSDEINAKSIGSTW